MPRLIQTLQLDKNEDADLIQAIKRVSMRFSNIDKLEMLRAMSEHYQPFTRSNLLTVLEGLQEAYNYTDKLLGRMDDVHVQAMADQWRIIQQQVADAYHQLSQLISYFTQE